MGGNLKKQLAPLALLFMLIVAISIPAIADNSDQGVSDPSTGYTNASDPVDVTTLDDGNVSTDLPGDVILDDGTDVYNVTDVQPLDENLSDGSDDSGLIAPVAYTAGYYGNPSCNGAADKVVCAASTKNVNCVKPTAAVNTPTNSSCSSVTKKTCNKSSCNKTK